MSSLRRRCVKVSLEISFVKRFIYFEILAQVLSAT